MARISTRLGRLGAELHHRIPRSKGGQDTWENLLEVWPTEHAAIDASRHTGYTIIKVL